MIHAFKILEGQMTTLTLKKITQTSLVGLFLASAVSGCAAQSASTDRASTNYSAPVLSVAAENSNTFYGAKKSIAVAKFDANGAFLNSYGGWDVGGGLSAMMVSELDETGAFRVVNRSDIDATLYEQSLSLQGLTATNTVKAGQLIGAQYLIRGSVTEFSEAKRGGGISVGGTFGGLLGGISPQRRTGHVGIDVSVIDSTTGEIVSSTTIRKEFKSTAIAASVTGKGWSVGGSKFQNTVLGEAAREAIAAAVQQIAGSLSGQAWTAQVAQVKGNVLYVNAGQDSGLKAGDTLTITRITDRVIDPVTGAVLGVEEAELGTATIASVKDQYAKATFNARYQPHTGDTLKLISGANFVSTNNFAVASR
jgi:curli biogenesis system outer membrane secretion channel CsgG